MRIRLRVPKEGERSGPGDRSAHSSNGDEPKPASGIADWFLSLFRKPSAPVRPPAAQPTQAKQAAPPAFDRRWTARGETRYLQSGRLCVQKNGNWQAEYLYDVFASGQQQQIRVVIPEPDVANWEHEHDKRMPESARLRLVMTTLEALLDLGRMPTAITVSAAEIRAVRL